MEWLQGVASVCGYATMIGTLVGAILRFSRRLERIERHQRNDYLAMLRLTIMAEEMPIEERLKAGEEYVREGGNGAVKARYQIMQTQYKSEIEGDKL